MKVELFQAAGCGSCARERDALKSAAQQAVPDLEWRDVDVMKELDYAVEIGILGVPALAVDGQLAFSSLPTPAQLNDELLRRVRARPHDGS
jgi:thioredoxin 1